MSRFLRNSCKHLRKKLKQKINKIVADLKKGKIIASNSENVKADCMITIKDEDFVGLASGTAKPQQVKFNLNNIY